MLWLCSPEELPEGCAAHRTKDDGILDCLRHFKEQGHHIFLCTLDKQFACRSQVRKLLFSINPLVSLRMQAHMGCSYPLRYGESQPVPSSNIQLAYLIIEDRRAMAFFISGNNAGPRLRCSGVPKARREACLWLL